ncbi:MAG: BatA and WFA domain-containing protein [Clostridia bacterium]|nr:BatA and WFA domain-containing protein [Clostridia bacterium]
MRLLYPLGLLGLIGVPVLILIYILKNKYTEQTVSSTYLWTLSEKFLKRKKPISKMAGIISLALQIAAVVFLSVALANPVFILPNAANDYCFILDGSGSMHTVQGNTTRFDLAKMEIENVIEDSADGSSYTLVFVGDATNVVYEKVEDKKKAVTLLQELNASSLASGVADAVAIAQEYFNENPALVTYLVSDKEYAGKQYVNTINVSDSSENYAVAEINYAVGENGLTVYAEVVSYESDKTLTVELYVNGEGVPAQTQTVSVQKMVHTPVSFTSDKTNFDSLRVRVKESDALSLDNEMVLYNVHKENEYSVLLVSDRPFFINSLFDTVSEADVTVLATNAYNAPTGYDLYIFDCYAPATLPSDGAVWFFNLQQNVDKTGITYQSTVEIEEKSGVEIELVQTGSNESMALSRELDGKGISLCKYVKYGRMRNFTTVFEYEETPIVFSGTNEYGNREVVFAFDLHDSNFPLKLDYIVLGRNLLEYSFPTVVESVLYECGDDALINVVSGCESIRIESPSGSISYLDTNEATATFLLTEIGSYKVTTKVGDVSREYHLYSLLGEEERTSSTVETVNLQGQRSNVKRDGKYQDLIVYFVLLSLLFLADWGVYCYDKYQLR